MRRVKLAIVLVALACAPSPARAAEPADYQSLAQAMAAPWPDRQRADGSFREYIPGHDPPLSLALFFATSHAQAMSKVLSVLFPQ